MFMSDKKIQKPAAKVRKPRRNSTASFVLRTLINALDGLKKSNLAPVSAARKSRR
jgi:hypothetical protein